jgi:hypothetical protein
MRDPKLVNGEIVKVIELRHRPDLGDHEGRQWQLHIKGQTGGVNFLYSLETFRKFFIPV